MNLSSITTTGRQYKLHMYHRYSKKTSPVKFLVISNLKLEGKIKEDILVTLIPHAVSGVSVVL